MSNTNQSKSNENDSCQAKQKANEVVVSSNNEASAITKATVGKTTVERAPLATNLYGHKMKIRSSWLASDTPVRLKASLTDSIL